MDLTRPPDDPDLSLLRRDAARLQRYRRRGNVVAGVVIGALALANVAVVAGPVLGVTPGGRVGVEGFTLLGRDAGAPPAESAALPRADDASRDGGRSAGSAQGAPAGGRSLPTWTGPAAPVAPRPETTAAPATVPATTTTPATTATASDAGETTTPARLTSTPTSSGSPTETVGSVPGLGKQVVDLVNAERADAGCPALTVDDRLVAAAEAHAVDMVARQYFDHTSPDGSTPSSRAAAAGYPGPVAENIATGYGTAAAVVEGWMDSPDHRANILDCDQRVTGVGHDPGSLPGYAPGTWVQVFGAG